MLKLNIFDDIFKKIASFFYRFSIIAIGWYIALNEGMTFAGHVYLVCSFFYVSFVIGLYYKKFNNPHLRLVLDFCYILVFCYGHAVANPLVTLYLMLPIINSPNHTGAKRDYFLYLYTLTSFVVASNGFKILFITPIIIVFSAIGWFEYTRYRITRFNTYLTNVLDECYYHNLELNKTHYIYRHIIKAINSASILNRYIRISNIYCLVEKSNNFFIVNTSTYVFNIEFEDKELFKEQLHSKEILSNVKMFVDGNPINSNICLKIKFKDLTYAFIVELQKASVHLIVYIISEYILKVICTRIVLVLELEHKINIIKKTYVEKYKINAEYIESAVNTMHFINNKLSPFKTLLQLMNKQKENEDPDKVIGIEELVSKTHLRSVTSLKSIEEKANKMLQSKNALLFRDNELHSLKKLFSTFKRVWNDYFDQDAFEIKWDKSCLDKNILVSNDGITLVFENLCDNLCKYNNGVYGVIFDEVDGRITITFYNNFKPPASEMSKLCKDFMSTDAQEIAMRKTLGLETLKKVLLQMPVQYDMCVHKDMLFFLLTFSEVADEENCNL